MPDQYIECATCRRSFTWTAGEQQFYRERGLQTPRHCPDCREARRNQTTAAPSSPRPTAAAPRSAAAPARPKPPARPITRRPSPRRAFGVTILVAAVVLSIVVFVLFPSSPLLAWLVAVNAVALFVYGYDKGIAGSNRTRIPEAVLLGLALIGGTLGAFASMVLFRHKTRKPAFLIPFALIVVLQFALFGAWLTFSQGG
jgi:uncharacterized membrane protein YsdA (DUF1294 family)